MGETDTFDDLTDDERAAVEELRRALEWFHRAHGSLVEFHHAVGSAMEHVDESAERLDGEHAELADRLRDDVLPAGVTADGTLTYELVADFEEGLLSDAEEIADAAFDDLAGGERHPIARRKENERASGDR